MQLAVPAQHGASIQMLGFLFAQKTLGKTKPGEQGHGLLGPSGHLRATKANQSWLATVLWVWGKYVAMVMVQHQSQKPVRETPGARCAS